MHRQPDQGRNVPQQTFRDHYLAMITIDCQYNIKMTFQIALEFAAVTVFVSMNGDEWHDQRRFTMHTMRDLGLGKGLWETMIQADAANTSKMKKRKRQTRHFVEPLGLSNSE
ncbi:hypothetical protein CEXT_290751 [Caerostris extrusa]|uniref:Uncharacterized protein n=1 Tax=Caerostris extrusa TaxID=172846 RepID=A0AAV4PBB4_CAEEX|nr:hypothetical protein CEXT_290751 [Caerostris extrusa]